MSNALLSSLTDYPVICTFVKSSSRLVKNELKFLDLLSIYLLSVNGMNQRQFGLSSDRQESNRRVGFTGECFITRIREEEEEMKEQEVIARFGYK